MIVKTAAIIPIGSLAENGYQHVFDPCIHSIAEAFDHVYLIQSHNDPRNLEKLSDISNMTLISGKGTWHKDGIYQSGVVNNNIRIGFDMAKLDGYDYGIELSCNYYVPTQNIPWLRARIGEAAPFAYVFRANLIAGQLFYPSKRLPLAIRIADYPETYHSHIPDGMYSNGAFYQDTYGDFREFEYECFVDVPLEMTLEEYKNKMNFLRCYSDIMPKRSPEFDWDYWRKYNIAKMSHWQPSPTPLDKWGNQIAGLTRPEFVSHELLAELSYG